MATFDTEIRRLQAEELCTLAMHLNEANYWQKLMTIIPKDENQNVSLFSPDHIRMIEQAIRQQQRSGAEIFLSEWSTLGRKRPTCKVLLDLLVKMEFFKAADYLAVDVLKIAPPERPKQGPAAVVDISDEMLQKLLEEQAQEQADLKTESGADLSWSVHYIEKPVNVIPVHSEKVQPQVEHSDLMKFSVVKSDLMKFSETVDLKKLPEQVSNVLKIDDKVEKPEVPLENYGLPVVDSGNIPLCVNFTEVYSNDNNVSHYSEPTQSTISSSSIISDSDSSLPTASENDIPIAILSDRSSKNT